MALLPWASTFSTESLEREYQVELGPEKVRLTRVMATLGVLLTCAFGVLDLWSVPSALAAVWALRAVTVTCLALTFWSTSQDWFQPMYTQVILGVATVMGVGVTAIICIATPAEAAENTYYGGLLLIIIGVYTLSYLTSHGVQRHRRRPDSRLPRREAFRPR